MAIDTLGIIGGGNMGEALLRGVLSRQLIATAAVTVSDASPERRAHVSREYGVTVTDDNRRAAAAHVVVMAVKPQNMQEVLSGLAGALDGKSLLVSVAAGVSTSVFETALPGSVRVVRAMPNMPALIGEGATALAAGKDATEGDLAVARSIFDAVGTTVVVPESLMNAVTGLSGSGPAYGFLLMEALTEAGVRLGMDREVALTLSAQTLLGAAKLCLRGEKTPEEYRRMVSSPGGTTIKALAVLEDRQVRSAIVEAVEAATRQAAVLGAALLPQKREKPA